MASSSDVRLTVTNTKAIAGRRATGDIRAINGADARHGTPCHEALTGGRHGDEEVSDLWRFFQDVKHP
ncbi:MAG: hypothetical protein VKP72_14050 [bacterium]|nr:hypothetical protein [bacterium]